jgi:PadR family transcriptional regulator PadR
MIAPLRIMCEPSHRGRGAGGRCWRHGGQIRSFLQPHILLLLAEKPAHGYELMERPEAADGPSADPGLLYRTLRQFEDEGLVRSAWDTRGHGPARRVYEITDEGQEYLHTWAINIRRTRERLERFLADYEQHYHRTEGR